MQSSARPQPVKTCYGVVSIGTFLSNPGCFLYRGIYYSMFSCFPFYSDDVIVVQKSPNENESKNWNCTGESGRGLTHKVCIMKM